MALVPAWVEVVRRRHRSSTWLFALNHTDDECRVPVSGHDLVSGRDADGAFGLSARTAAVLRRPEVLATQCRSAIVALVEETGAARISDLIEHLGVSGTTTYALAVAIRHLPKLTVVTNSVPVAQLLHESQSSGHVVVLTGGVRTPSDALVGPVAVNALQGLHVDRLFLGAHGIDPGAGLTTPNLVEAETNRALVRATRSVCVLADHTKFGIIGLSTFLALREVDTLITDSGLSHRTRSVLAESVDDVLLADVPRSPAARTAR